MFERQIETLKGMNATPPPTQPIVIDQNRMALLVGLVVVLLPTVLILSARISPQICSYDSISHYYFAPFAGSFFVGSLGFIALFLFAYKGHKPIDNWMSILAGIAAAGVAIFPTSGAGCAYGGETALLFSVPKSDALLSPVNVFTDVEILGQKAYALHKYSAAALFLILAWFNIVSFRRNNGTGVVVEKDGKRYKTTKKRARNRIYLICGVLMIICVFWIWWILDFREAPDNERIFLPETIALYAFAISWLVKSKIIKAFDG